MKNKATTALITTVLLWSPLTLRAQMRAASDGLMPSRGWATVSIESARYEEQELLRLSRQIGLIEQKANASAPVRATMYELQETVAEHVLQLVPGLVDSVARQAELYHELIASAPQQVELEEREGKLAEYQRLRRQIQPVEEQVQESDTVVRAREAYVAALMDEMRQIEPQVEKLLHRYQALAGDINQRTSESKRLENEPGKPSKSSKEA